MPKDEPGREPSGTEARSHLEDSSPGFVRLSGGPETVDSALGPLANLVGTWMGSRGWELIAVPSSPEFRLIVRPYFEIITFSPLGALVPNRGGPVPDLFISGLHYDIRIADAETNEPLHLENGMWLILPGQNPAIARLACIPHGDVLLALGSSSQSAGPPTIPDISALPTMASPPPRFGYTDAYSIIVDGFNPSQPNGVLQTAIDGQDIVETVSLDVSTQGGGGILNIPYVDANADATSFSCTYWIETVQDAATGTQFQQLQYSQVTNIEFLRFKDTDPLIIWPHVNVNTLVKQ